MMTREDDEVRHLLEAALDSARSEPEWAGVKKKLRESMDELMEWIDRKYPGFPASCRRMVIQAAADRVFDPMVPEPEALLRLHEIIQKAHPSVPGMAVAVCTGEELVEVAMKYAAGGIKQ